jgi:hypothetical protein
MLSGLNISSIIGRRFLRLAPAKRVKWAINELLLSLRLPPFVSAPAATGVWELRGEVAHAPLHGWLQYECVFNAAQTQPAHF